MRHGRKRRCLEQFTRFGVDHGAFDDVVTSGGAARDFLAARPGIRVFHVGAERDLAIYEGLDLTLSGEEDAEIISCTGLFDDETETPDDYAESVCPLARPWPAAALRQSGQGGRAWRQAGLVCRGAGRKLCGHRRRDHHPRQTPPADLRDGMARFAALAGGPVDTGSVLAIGDAVETDLRGANDFGLDVLFVTAGIHAEAYGERETPDAAKVGAFLGRRRDRRACFHSTPDMVAMAADCRLDRSRATRQFAGLSFCGRL